MRDCKIVQLDEDNLAAATEFAEAMEDDPNFLFFTHHMPENMLTNEFECYLAIVDSEVIGWGHIQKFPHNPRKQHVCIVGFCVDPKFRGLGYGGLLCDHIIFDRCEPYFNKINATVFQDNIIMYGMFVRRGFHVEGCFVNEEMNGKTYRHVLSLARLMEI